MCLATVAARSRASGFTLIELMIVVAVIAILAAIAIPMFQTYIIRSKIIDATSHLGDLRIQMEKYFMDNRTYLNGAACGVAPVILIYNGDPARYFDYTCAALAGPPPSYVLRATGIAARGMNGFDYRINEQNAKSTPGVYPGWAGGGSLCWVLKSDGSC